MHARSVSALYDALFELESRRRQDGAYPVHKRLQLPQGRGVDIYDWVAERLPLRSADRVLDVGCGVGFGAIRTAERGATHVTGITISRQERDRAVAASTRSPRAQDIDFEWGSFDRLPRESFDAVIAVESLKHSADLGITLGAILDSMVPGGRPSSWKT